MGVHRKNFFTSIIHAGGFASIGEKQKMNKYLSEARQHHKSHINEYSTKNEPAEVKSENDRMNSYYDKIKRIYNGDDIEKSELSKAFSNVSPSRKEWKHAQPGQKAGLTYKPYASLTPDQQVAAKNKFQGNDMESFHYPLHEDGTVAHSGRWKDPTPPPAQVSNSKNPMSRKNSNGTPSDAPVQVSNSQVAPKLTPAKGELLPHHHRDSVVKISSEGHENHGERAIVQAPSPYHPGKIHVKVKGNVSRFLEPHEAVPHNLDKSEDNVVSISRAILEKLKKRS